MEAGEMMTAGDTKSTGAGARGAASAAEVQATAEPPRRNLESRDKPNERIALQPVGKLFSPTGSLVWMIGLLGVTACIAPWIARGWLLFGLIVTTVALLASYDAFALWLAREECAPVLLPPGKGLRGREGKTIQVPLALTGSGRRRLRSEVRVAIMPATPESETAIRVQSGTQGLKLEQPEPAAGGSTSASSAPIQLWPWTPEIALLRRGLWPGPRVGIERCSRLGFWRLRQWFDSPEQLRIEADLRSGRREILRSPVYRTLVASRQTPWTGHGRDFERLREYQAGDTYSEIAWKSTARRGAPVTRLFQWEQKQEVYFVVDQSRASAVALDPATATESNAPQARAQRRLLDLVVETALVGATVALELGDEFGLVTFAEEPKSWLRAGSGQSQFHQFRDRLLHVEPLPTTADYETLFSEIRVRLRRRAYLLLLADLTMRSVSDSLRRGVGLVRSSHALLMTSILPAHARPAFSLGEELHTDQNVYAALAGEKENQRLGALKRQLRQLNVQLRYIPAEMFLRKAVEGYLESKREQRL
ncbi:MAG TPA: DUF58 domain-containing protein [Candidatus Dormibacteraeota bacterium]|nr:DUF58 domain-containing protein [Candidatus Dormibacteraeota bacterium]